MLKRLFKNEKGMTLVELLAVIVILGIVAGIAVPSVMSIIQKSKVNAAKSDALQILSAAATYAASNPDKTSITEYDLNDYIGDNELDTTATTDTASDYTVTVSDNGKIFTLTNNAKVTVGSASIRFTAATSKGISKSDTYKGDITISN